MTISKSTRFRAELSVDFPKSSLAAKLVGDITEEADLESVWSYIAKLGTDVNSVEFDLGGIERINSEGMMRWSKFLQRVQSRMACSFSMISIALVEQAGSVSGALGKPGTSVRAFQAPFICRQCGIEKVQTLTHELVSLPTGKYSAPAMTCDDCGSRLEFDQLENEYFAFLDRVSTRTSGER